MRYLNVHCQDQLELTCIAAAADSLSGELRAALHDCCVTFAHSTQQASGLMPKQAQEEAEEDSPSEQAEVPVEPVVTDAKLLLLYSNCVQVRTVVLSNLLDRSVAEHERLCLQAIPGQPGMVLGFS